MYPTIEIGDVVIVKITKEIGSNTNNFNIITLMPLCCLIILISLMLTLKVIKVRDKQNNK